MFSKGFSGSVVPKEEGDVPTFAGHQLHGSQDWLLPAQHHGPALPGSAWGWRSRLCQGLLVSSDPREAVFPLCLIYSMQREGS